MAALLRSHQIVYTSRALCIKTLKAIFMYNNPYLNKTLFEFEIMCITHMQPFGCL